MPRIPLTACVAAAALAASLGACGSRDETLTRRINARPSMPLDATLRLAIGAEADTSEPAALLAGVGNAIIDQGEHLAIVDGGSSSIRLFDARGRFVRSVGRDGSGPGEFRLPTWIGGCWGGGYAAWDFGRKVVYYDSLWNYRDEVPIPAAVTSARPLACLTGGVIVATVETGGRVPEGGGLVRLPTSVLRIRPREGRVDTIATFAGTEYFFSRRSPTFLDVPLGRATRVAVRLQDVVVASTDSTTLHVLSLNGAPVTQWPLGLTRRHASLDDQRRAFEERLEALQLLRTRRMLRPLLEELPRVDQFPYFETLVTDDSARIWIKTYDGAGTPWRLWQVVGDRGGVRATVRLPAKAQVTTIAQGCIVAIERDSVGTERVRVYGMRTGEKDGLMAPCPLGLTALPSSTG